MATDPRFMPPSPELESEPVLNPVPPLNPLPPAASPARPRRGAGVLAIAVLSAVVGAIAGSGATIFTAQQLSKSSYNTGSSLVAPLATVTNNLTEQPSIINVADNARKTVVELQTIIPSTDNSLQQGQRGL